MPLGTYELGAQTRRLGIDGSGGGGGDAGQVEWHSRKSRARDGGTVGFGGALLAGPNGIIHQCAAS